MLLFPSRQTCLLFAGAALLTTVVPALLRAQIDMGGVAEIAYGLDHALRVLENWRLLRGHVA